LTAVVIGATVAVGTGFVTAATTVFTVAVGTGVDAACAVATGDGSCARAGGASQPVEASAIAAVRRNQRTKRWMAFG
jgi:hypothetical protein